MLFETSSLEPLLNILSFFQSHSTLFNIHPTENQYE